MEQYAHVKKSAISGNGLFTNQKIPGGRLILSISRPLVAALDTEYVETICSNCFQQTGGSAIGNLVAPKPLKVCGGCRRLKFCDKVTGVSIFINPDTDTNDGRTAKVKPGNGFTSMIAR